MRTQRINVVSSVTLIVFSLAALSTVVTGLIWPRPMPEPDEGTQAHIFQLSVAAVLPMTIIVLATSDWRQPGRSVGQLVTAVGATAMAFVGLYYLEHLR